jgi:hypothetical protein
MMPTSGTLGASWRTSQRQEQGLGVLGLQGSQTLSWHLAGGMSVPSDMRSMLESAYIAVQTGEAHAQCTAMQCIFIVYLGRVGTGEGCGLARATIEGSNE